MLLGIQKYFIAAAVAAFLAVAVAAFSYRASYNAEYNHRVTVEAQLRETVATLDNLRATYTRQMQAVQAAEEASKAEAEARRLNRESILNAPTEDDGSVSRILRCAIDGVCEQPANR